MSSKKVKQQLSLSIEESKVFLTHIISNNRYLQENNKIPVSVAIEGDSGIGKTSMILQLAEELDLHMIKLNLSQIEELGDLVGFPIRQFEMKKEESLIWVDEHVIDEYKIAGYSSTGNNRMSYCPPEWISGKTKGGILLLDDWNRADIRFLQAVMELIDRQQYISWKLPKDWHILLTSNPDNGDYLVNSIDNAQKTRFISVNLKFDIDCWGKWAEKAQLDTRCITFLLMHPELVTKEINSRSVSMFFNSISSIKTFEEDLPLIQMIGEGSVGPEFSTLFTTFINNKLDRIISPKEIMFGENWDSIERQLKTVIGKDDKYRADIASTIASRIINYTLFVAEKEPTKIKKEYIERIVKLIIENIFAMDLRYIIVKQIYNGDPSKFKGMTLNPKLVSYIMKS